MSICKIISSLFILTVVICGLQVSTAKADNRIVYSQSEAEKLCGPVPSWDIDSTTPYNPKVIGKSLTYNRAETLSQRSFVCMKTSLPEYRNNGGIGWVVSPEFSVIGYTDDGAYYLGTDDGRFRRCNNKIYKIVVVEETFVPTVTVTPTPSVTPAPAPTPLVCGPNQTLSSNGQYCVETKVLFAQPCANDLAIKGKSRFVKDRVGGSWLKKLFSFGLSATGTLIAGGDVGTAIRNGVIGVVIQTGQTMVNPSEGAIMLSGAGLAKPVILPKGKNYEWVSGDKSYRLIWQGDVATVYGATKVAEKVFESACYSYNPKEASNLGVYVTGGSSQTYSTGVDKIQPLNQIEQRPVVIPTSRYQIGDRGFCSRPSPTGLNQVCQVVSVDTMTPIGLANMSSGYGVLQGLILR